jgi:hypothetical protein
MEVRSGETLRSLVLAADKAGDDSSFPSQAPQLSLAQKIKLRRKKDGTNKAINPHSPVALVLVTHELRNVARWEGHSAVLILAELRRYL